MRTWLLILMGSSLAGGSDGVGLSTIPYVLPEIRIPIPKARPLAVQSIQQGRVAWQPPLLIGGVCGGVVELSEDDFPALGLIDLFGSVEEYRTALGADAVEIVELEAVVDPFTPPAERNSDSVKLGAKDGALLRAVLTCDAAYEWKAVSPGSSRDGYRVKFKAGRKVVSLDLFLSAGCVRAAGSNRVPLSARFEFSRSPVASIINRHFPGASDEG